MDPNPNARMDHNELDIDTQSSQGNFIEQFVFDESELAGKTLEQIHESFLAKNQIFLDRKSLVEFVKMISATHNFSTYISFDKIQCSQGKPRPSKAQKPQTSIKIDCPWEIRFNSFLKIRDKKKNLRCNFEDGNKIYIRSTTWRHTCACSPRNKMWVISKNGDLLKKYLTPPAMFLLAHHLQYLPTTCFRSLRSILSRMFPSSIAWTGWRIANVRKFILKRIKSMETEETGYLQFQDQFSSKDFLDDFKNVVCEEDINKTLSYDIWKEALDSEAGSGRKLLDQMEGMKQSIEGFDYRFAKNADNVIISVIWMTDVMRGNLYRAPENVSTDMRHAKTNDLLWPYISVIVRDVNMKIAVCCEGFCVGETRQMYKFLFNAMFEMAPLSSKDDVLVVNGDGKLDEDLVAEFGLRKAHFVEDPWHIKNTKLVKDYGKSFEDNQDVFHRLLNTSSDVMYDNTIEEIKRLLGNNMNKLHKIRDFASRKQYHARHVVINHPGSFGRVSSTPSEQNHSSIASWQGTYFASIMSNVHNLYMRHLHRVAVTSFGLITSELHLKGITSSLDESSITLRSASGILNLEGFVMFQAEFVQSFVYRVEDHPHDVGKSKISRTDRPDSEGRIIEHSVGHCVVCEISCRHVFYYCRHTIAYIRSTSSVGLIDREKIARRYWKQKDVLRLKCRRNGSQNDNNDDEGLGQPAHSEPQQSEVGQEFTGGDGGDGNGGEGASDDGGDEIVDPMHIPIIRPKAADLTTANVPAYSDLLETATEICSLVKHQDNNVQFYFSGMLVSLKQILFCNEEAVDNKINTIADVHMLHKNFVEGLKTCSVPQNNETLYHPGNKMILRNPIKRIRGRREISLQTSKLRRKMAAEKALLRRSEDTTVQQHEGIPDLQRNVEKIPACSICGMTGHTRVDCKTHQHYFPLIRKDGIGNYKRYLLSDAPLCKSPVSKITQDVFSRLIQSVQVLSVHALTDASNISNLSEKELAFKVNIMERRTNMEIRHEEVFIIYDELRKFLDACDDKSRFVYSKVEENSVGNNYMRRRTENTNILQRTFPHVAGYNNTYATNNQFFQGGMTYGPMVQTQNIQPLAHNAVTDQFRNGSQHHHQLGYVSFPPQANAVAQTHNFDMIQNPLQVQQIGHFTGNANYIHGSARTNYVRNDYNNVAQGFQHNNGTRNRTYFNGNEVGDIDQQQEP